MVRTVSKAKVARTIAVAAAGLTGLTGCGDGDASARDAASSTNAAASRPTQPQPIASLTSTTLPKPRTVYTVKSGDQLRFICRKFKITLQDVIAFNQMLDADHIEVGQKIKIPPKGWHRPEPRAKPTPPATTIEP